MDIKIALGVGGLRNRETGSREFVIPDALNGVYEGWRTGYTDFAYYELDINDYKRSESLQGRERQRHYVIP